MVAQPVMNKDLHFLEFQLRQNPYFLNNPIWLEILLFRRIGNAIDDTEIKAAVRRIRLKDSGDGMKLKYCPSLVLQISDWIAYRCQTTTHK